MMNQSCCENVPKSKLTTVKALEKALLRAEKELESAKFMSEYWEGKYKWVFDENEKFRARIEKAIGFIHEISRFPSDGQELLEILEGKEAEK